MKLLSFVSLVFSLVFVFQAHADSTDLTNSEESIFKESCRTRPGLGILVSPRFQKEHQPLRVLVVSERLQPKAQLLGRGPSGAHKLTVMTRGGPPYWWFAQITEAESGRHIFRLVDEKGRTLACAHQRIAKRLSAQKTVADFWPLKRSWDRTMENFYSAWIEKLFDSPIGSRPSWIPLHQVIRDPTRNLLYNHLGYQEDGPNEKNSVVLQPDCADLPYYLRTYFAWKLQLPLGYRLCDRGNSNRPPNCGELHTNEGKLVPKEGGDNDAAKAFSFFLRKNVSYVHSASGRTAPEDNETDLYPVKPDRKSLRPGVVYVDPYGHLLVISHWVSQTEDESGLLFAIDGHPDLSVGRKRFWRGAFLFNNDIRGGAGGFKAFRPLVVRDGKTVALTNEEINDSHEYGNFSVAQYRLGLEGFYDWMDRVINPRPLSPTKAYHERLKALYELILERVDAVQAGEDHMRNTGYKTIEMPKGPRIFETQGPWEDFSTPARDMRLLIAIEDVLRYPEKVVSAPERFALPQGQSPQQAKQDVEEFSKKFCAEKRIAYLRSDGSRQELTMTEVIRRRKDFEMAYNPNDCVEIRWGGEKGEMSTCKRRAPANQLELMLKYRLWFATRNRPPIR
ncbi:MAG: hypothetical protein V1754_02860 [Pseudomonadota bacterium]